MPCKSRARSQKRYQQIGAKACERAGDFPADGFLFARLHRLHSLLCDRVNETLGARNDLVRREPVIGVLERFVSLCAG